MELVDRRPVVCRNLAMGFWVPLQQEQGAKREHEGGDNGNTKKRSRFMRMARKLRNKGFEVTCPAEL